MSDLEHADDIQDAGSSAFNRLLRRFSRKTVPAADASLRSRRGIAQASNLELDLAAPETTSVRKSVVSVLSTETGGELSQSSRTVAPASVDRQRGSVRADSLRKREKIAELRRRRQQQLEAADESILASPGSISGGGSGSGGGAAVTRAGASLAALFKSPPRAREPSESRYMNRGTSVASSMHVADAAAEEFINNPELNLLLGLIDVEPLVSAAVDPEHPPAAASPPTMQPPVDSAPVSAVQAKTMQRANSHSGYATATGGGAVGDADFTINIPTTSLSPVVPFGFGRALGEHGLARRLSARLGRPSRTSLLPKQIAEAEANKSDASDGDGGDDSVFAELEAERRTNLRLRKELAKINAEIDAVARLAHANKALGEISGGQTGTLIKH
ncbi:hypothetical protein GGI07_001871 [Coemansia sp. Benny D115]|nr:hypothetical protein GGI07_001871 [Coemansia sp. Benny D115]